MALPRYLLVLSFSVFFCLQFTSVSTFKFMPESQHFYIKHPNTNTYFTGDIKDDALITLGPRSGAIEFTFFPEKGQIVPVLNQHLSIDFIDGKYTLKLNKISNIEDRWRLPGTSEKSRIVWNYPKELGSITLADQSTYGIKADGSSLKVGKVDPNNDSFALEEAHTNSSPEQPPEKEEKPGPLATAKPVSSQVTGGQFFIDPDTTYRMQVNGKFLKMHPSNNVLRVDDTDSPPIEVKFYEVGPQTYKLKIGSKLIKRCNWCDRSNANDEYNHISVVEEPSGPPQGWFTWKVPNSKMLPASQASEGGSCAQTVDKDAPPPGTVQVSPNLNIYCSDYQKPLVLNSNGVLTFANKNVNSGVSIIFVPVAK